MRLQSLDSTAPPLSSEPGGIGLSDGATALAASATGVAGTAAAKAPAPAPAVAPTSQQLADAVKQANASLQKVASSLQFTIDPDTKETIIQLVDTSDHKVLRQMPSPEVIAI